MPGLFTLSVVSHRHAEQVKTLLSQVAKAPEGIFDKVIVTVNVPEQHAGWAAANLQLIHNQSPKGFGANHNHAFGLCESPYFCVVNPDVELRSCMDITTANHPVADQNSGRNPGEIFNALAKVLSIPGLPKVGLAYPAQCQEDGTLLDFARPLVTPAALVKRKLGLSGGARKEHHRIDWVSGAFMAFHTDVFAALGGFDERYFMYCEDVDICLRLQLSGYRLALADATVVHHAQRSTLKKQQHLAWHVRSLLCLWRSSAYRSYVDHLAMQKK
jgi:N-acetylglucosaminyl-diphospho-decaprenol L-rhamnosyltransferase